MIVFSKSQVEPIIRAIEKREEQVKCTTDLGKTITVLQIKNKEVIMPDLKKIELDDLKKIAKKEVCFYYEDGKIFPITLFSENTQRYYKLLPLEVRDHLSKAVPTIEISGIRMHQFSKKNPLQDTSEKIKCANPKGVVLDTCCGLGYTAIMASNNASKVITVEIDKNVTEIAKYNPWSEELFTKKNIEYLNGDSFYVIDTFLDETFDVIIHDPPTLKLGGDLYSQEFYNKLYRVTKKGGRLYHYTGKPGFKTRGIDLAKGAEKRLSKAGYSNISFSNDALGIIAEKL